MKSKPKGVNTLPAIYCLRIHPDLKEAIGQAAEEADLPLNEWIAHVLAERLGKPELATIPRKVMGRPRTKKPPEPQPA